jgi:hypothetical protein
MIEIEIYAARLREGDNVLQLRNQMDLMPRVRYKIDVNHDIVYFEADSARDMTLEQITAAFTDIGLQPRVVGQLPEELTEMPEVTGAGTTRLR